MEEEDGDNEIKRGGNRKGLVILGLCGGLDDWVSLSHQQKELDLFLLNSN